MVRDEYDPETWLCEVWWPPQWRDHDYAADFDFLRAFGREMLSRPGGWRVRLTAADPVAQFVDVSIGGRKVAEVAVGSDVPEGEPRRFRFCCFPDWEDRSAPDPGGVTDQIVRAVDAADRSADRERESRVPGGEGRSGMRPNGP